MMSIPEFNLLNKELLRKEKMTKKGMKIMNTDLEIITCDCCRKMITDFDTDLYHITGCMDGSMNKHIHLCFVCFENHVTQIPVIRKKKSETIFK